MDTIRTMKALLEALPHCTRKEYRAIARRMEIPLAEFAPYAFWSQSHYTRNCIKRTEQFELILLCWGQGQETPVHCHNGEECWVKVLDGTIEETRYQECERLEDLKEEETMVLTAPRLSYMNDDMGFHALRNLTPGRAMTLHLYVNPITECRVLDKDAGVFVKKALRYDSLEGRPQPALTRR